MRLLFNSPFCRLAEAPHTEIHYFADKKHNVDDAVLDFAFANVTSKIENTAYTREKYDTAKAALLELSSVDMPCDLEVGLLPEDYLTNHIANKEEAMLLEITPEDSKKLHFYDKYVAEVVFNLPQFCPTDEGISSYIFTIVPKALESFAYSVLYMHSTDKYSAQYNTHVINPDDAEPTLLIPLLYTNIYPVRDDAGEYTIGYSFRRLTPDKTFRCFPSRVMA